MKTHLAAKLLVTTTAIALVTAPAAARKATTLTDLNGSRASSAEGALQDRGFKYIAGHKGSYDSSYTYWWHSTDKNCVVVETMDGRVMTINDATDSDCGHSGNSGNAAAAVGVIAGAALVGALLASKAHHREGKTYNEQQTAYFDRGYKDGLYNASYHNNNRSDAYSDGYRAGVDEREANLRHHHNRGGYEDAADYQDLQGARAAGAMDELEGRGFRQVDNFTSGNTRYSIQWRAASRQCLQATIADGRIYDISDIEHHPKCR